MAFTCLNSLMNLQIFWVRKVHWIKFAWIWLYTCVNSLMNFHLSRFSKRLCTKLAWIWLFTCVNPLINLQISWVTKVQWTKFAWICFFTCVNPLMSLYFPDAVNFLSQNLKEYGYYKEKSISMNFWFSWFIEILSTNFEWIWFLFCSHELSTCLIQ